MACSNCSRRALELFVRGTTGLELASAASSASRTRRIRPQYFQSRPAYLRSTFQTVSRRYVSSSASCNDYGFPNPEAPPSSSETLDHVPVLVSRHEEQPRPRTQVEEHGQAGTIEKQDAWSHTEEPTETASGSNETGGNKSRDQLASQVGEVSSGTVQNASNKETRVEVRLRRKERRLAAGLATANSMTTKKARAVKVALSPEEATAAEKEEQAKHRTKSSAKEAKASKSKSKDNLLASEQSKPSRSTKNTKERKAAKGPIAARESRAVEKSEAGKGPKTIEKSFAKVKIAETSANTKKPEKELEPWQVQKEALEMKFGEEGWNPRKKLSPDAILGIRELHHSHPQKYRTPILSNQFEVTPEAIRRILRSKWTPNEDKLEERRERWHKRGARLWEKAVEMGTKPPKRWREMGVGRVREGEEVPRWKSRGSFAGTEREERGPRSGGIRIEPEILSKPTWENRSANWSTNEEDGAKRKRESLVDRIV